MSTSTALKLLALLLASVARDARSARATPAPVRALAPMAVAAGGGRRRRERAGRVPGAVRRRGVRAGVRGERGGDVRE
jgi:hypothetical protein